MGNKSNRNKNLEINLETFTNEPHKVENLTQLLKSYYIGAMKNAIGIAEAINKEGDIETILVGMGPDGLFPIAKCLTAADLEYYRIADGEGNYVNQYAA